MCCICGIWQAAIGSEYKVLLWDRARKQLNKNNYSLCLKIAISLKAENTWYISMEIFYWKIGWFGDWNSYCNQCDHIGTPAWREKKRNEWVNRKDDPLKHCDGSNKRRKRRKWSFISASAVRYWMNVAVCVCVCVYMCACIRVCEEAWDLGAFWHREFQNIDLL